MADPARLFEGRTIVVTGASGYVASQLIDRLSHVACRIVGVSRTKIGEMSGPAKATVEFVAGDLNSESFLEKTLSGADAVFHLAAQTSTYKANEDPATDARSNVWPLFLMLEVCRRKAWKPFVALAGAATEVGVTDKIPVNESFLDAPLTTYDLHKLLAENYLKYYARQGFVTGTTLRLANVYGPGPRSSSADRGILNMMVRRALNGDALTVYGKGDNIRDYVFIDDVVDAFLVSATSEKTNGRHFVLGSGEGHTILEAIQTVAACVEKKNGKPVEIKHMPPPSSQSPIEARNFVADTSAFRMATGWQPRVSFLDGVNRTIDHWIKEKV